jgi:Uma2 family endonuclease
MSAKPTDTDKVTFREFCRLVPDGQKADLIDGVIHMASPDSLEQNDLTRFVSALMTMYNEAKKLRGRVFVTRYAFRLSRFRAPEPDVAYVRPERLHLASRRWMRGGPDAAVEVVSRESRERDYGEKKRLYERARVEEYWIIDPVQRRVEFHRLRGNRYELVPLEANRLFRSSVLPGFWLDVNWLLTDPLPNVYECLQELLK